jgi:phage tail sheath gpL-like
MAISFRNIPSNLRVPLAYFELDNTMAGSYTALQTALLLGSVAAGMPLAPNTPTLVISADHASQLAGVGSAFHRQCMRWFQNNASVPLYLLAEEEDAGYTASAGAIQWTGPATGRGTIPLDIGNRLVRITVVAGEDAAAIAQAAADAISTRPDTGVDATAAADTTTITARQLGILGGVDLNFALAGAIGGEAMPPGVTATVTRMTGSTGSPDIAQLLAAAGSDPYDFVMSPYWSEADLNDLDEWMNDASGRWAWSQQLHGHCFTAVENRVGGLSNLGRTRNGQHVSIFGFFGSHTPHDEWLASYVGQAAGSLIIDPARPVQALPLIGVRAPDRENRFSILERQVLYFDGISSYYTTQDGTVYIDRLITTYRVNQWGAPDNSYLDVETMFTAMYYNRFMHQRITQKYPRHKLASDGTRFGAGQAIVTPRILRAEFISAYGELIDRGIMENIEGFENYIVVERNATDPNRVDVLAPPDFVNQLRIAAVLVQFRLQGPTA